MIKKREFKIENIGKQTDFKKGGVIKCIDNDGKSKTIVKLDSECKFVVNNREEFKLNLFEMVNYAKALNILKGYIIEDNK